MAILAQLSVSVLTLSAVTAVYCYSTVVGTARLYCNLLLLVQTAS